MTKFKKLSGICGLLVLSLLPARAQQIITATVSVTNAANLVSGTSALTINSDTRTWSTNAILGGQIPIPGDLAAADAATNLFYDALMMPFSGILTSQASSNGVSFMTVPGGTISLSLTGTNWATVAWGTNTLSPAVAARIPLEAETPAQQTNIASGLVHAINSNANTNAIATNSTAASAIMAAIGAAGGGNVLSSNLDYITPEGLPLDPLPPGGTNYNFDFGWTNQYGNVVYFSIWPQDHAVNFLAVTNARRWGLLSINVISRTTNAATLVTMPTNLLAYDTDGFATSEFSTNGLISMAGGSLWGIWLTNGSELRLTLQSNYYTLSTLWLVTGPSSAALATGSGGGSTTNITYNTNVWTGSGSNSVLSSMEVDTPPLYALSTTLIGIRFDINDAVFVRLFGPGGAIGLTPITWRDAASSPYVLESHDLFLVNGSSTNIPVIWFTNNIIWDSDSGLSIPVTNINPNVGYHFRLSHISGSTNVAIGYRWSTNAAWFNLPPF